MIILQYENRVLFHISQIFIHSSASRIISKAPRYLELVFFFKGFRHQIIHMLIYLQNFQVSSFAFSLFLVAISSCKCQTWFIKKTSCLLKSCPLATIKEASLRYQSRRCLLEDKGDDQAHGPHQWQDEATLDLPAQKEVAKQHMSQSTQKQQRNHPTSPQTGEK